MNFPGRDNKYTEVYLANNYDGDFITMNDKKLTRSTEDRMFFGVAGGIAAYLEIDPILVRLFFVLLTLSTGYAFIAYVVLALLMPEDQPAAKANGFDDEEIIIH